MPDMKLVQEAQKTIKGIKQFQSTAQDKFANIDRQIADMTEAQKKMQIAASAPKRTEYAGDHIFKQYINEDGSLRLHDEKRRLQIKFNLICS